MNDMKMQLIMPTLTRDFVRADINFDEFFNLFPIKEMLLIGPADLEDVIKGKKDASDFKEKIRFVNENEVLLAKSVQEAVYEGFLKKHVRLEGFPGWYYQQFLKYSFAMMCQDEYYLEWDADTHPLKKVKLFTDDGKPVFHIKQEYVPGYFQTLNNLFPDMDNILDGTNSFVAEHMLFNVSYVKEMIEKIMNTPYEGDTYYRKIIEATQSLNRGFSEFETYGNYMNSYHNGVYALEEWKSLRAGGLFFKPGEITDKDKQWLSTDFSAITFERYNSYMPELAELFQNEEYRATMSPYEIYTIILQSDMFIKREEGMVSPI